MRYFPDRNVTFLFFAVCSVCTAEARTLTVADEREGTALPVSVAADASERAMYAAGEFAAYVEKITGVRVRTVTNAPASLAAVRITEAGEDDVFSIACRDGSLHISGGRRGVLYGVYELLENRWGCEWFTSSFEIVPRKERLDLPAGFAFTGRPTFDERFESWYDVLRNQEFAAKLRVTLPRAEEKFGGPAFAYDKVLNKAHTFFRLVSPEEYFESHPEYFSEIGGKRVKDFQLCLTNPDVLAITIEKTLKRIREIYPAIKTFGISQNDSTSVGCECAECRALDGREGSPAGSLITFVNKVAEAVEKEFPDVTIGTLAYSYTRVPPKTVRPRHNVLPCLCTIECDRTRPLAESRWKENVSFVSNLVRWAEISAQIQIWDYATEFRHYTCPHPIVNTYRANLAFFRDNKVRRMGQQGNSLSPHGDFTALKAWLLAKWMWDPDLDQETLMKRFFDGYYGAAAPYVRRYFDELHAMGAARDERERPTTCYAEVSSRAYTDAFFERSAELWRQAKEAVKGDARREKHVAWGAFCIDVSRVERYLTGTGFRHFSVSRRAMKRDMERFTAMRDLARSLLPMLDEKPPVKLAENFSRNSMFNNSIRAFAALETLPQPADKAFVPAWTFYSSMRFRNRGRMTLRHTVAMDRGVKYKARVQVMRRSAVKPAMFDVRLRAGGKTLAVVSRKSPAGDGELKAGKRQWFDMGEWTADGAGIVYFDTANVTFLGIELERVPEPVSIRSSSGNGKAEK